MSDQITVRRVRTQGGSRIDPPLDQSWDNLTALRWHAAVVRTDTGVEIDVSPAEEQRKILGVWVSVPNLYNIQYPGGCMGAYSFDAAWAVLTGVDLGCELARGKS